MSHVLPHEGHGHNSCAACKSIGRRSNCRGYASAGTRAGGLATLPVLFSHFRLTAESRSFFYVAVCRTVTPLLIPSRVGLGSDGLSRPTRRVFSLPLFGAWLGDLFYFIYLAPMRTRSRRAHAYPLWMSAFLICAFRFYFLFSSLLFSNALRGA